MAMDIRVLHISVRRMAIADIMRIVYRMNNGLVLANVFVIPDISMMVQRFQLVLKMVKAPIVHRMMMIIFVF